MRFLGFEGLETKVLNGPDWCEYLRCINDELGNANGYRCIAVLEHVTKNHNASSTAWERVQAAEAVRRPSLLFSTVLTVLVVLSTANFILLTAVYQMPVYEGDTKGPGFEVSSCLADVSAKALQCCVTGASVLSGFSATLKSLSCTPVLKVHDLFIAAAPKERIEEQRRLLCDKLFKKDVSQSEPKSKEKNPRSDKATKPTALSRSCSRVRFRGLLWMLCSDRHIELGHASLES
eukprot:s791_g8.t1